VLAGKSFKDLQALPRMNDPTKLAVMELLGLTIPPAYWTSADLLALIVFQMVEESVRNGHTPNAGYGYYWWGIIQCSLLGKIDRGYDFGKFGVALAKKQDLPLQRPLFFWGWIIRQFKHPIRESVEPLKESYTLSLGKGDFEYASYALNNLMQAYFHAGRELPTLLDEMVEAHNDLERLKVGSSLFWHDIWWQTALNFTTPGDSPHLLIGRGYDESESMPQHLKENDASTLLLLYCAKLILSVFFNNMDEAMGYVRQARTCLQGGAGMFAFVLFHYYESLTLLAQADRLSGIKRRRQMLKVVANQRKLKRWAGFSPENHLHRWYLVRAEYLRVCGKEERAVRFYDLAIDQAHKQGFIQDGALASELAGRYFHRQCPILQILGSI
jgi:predicted ATPase